MHPAEPTKFSWPFFRNAGLTGHLVSSLRSEPSSNKGAFMLLGFLTGLYSNRDRYEGEEELSKEYLGYVAGLALGLFDNNILIKYPLIDRLGLFVGGFALARFMALSHNAERAKALKTEKECFDDSAKEKIAQKNGFKQQFAHLADTTS